MRKFAIRYTKPDGTKEHYHIEADDRDDAILKHHAEHPETASTGVECIEITPPERVTGVYLAIATLEGGKEQAIMVDINGQRTPLMAFSGGADETDRVNTLRNTCQKVANTRDVMVTLVKLEGRENVAVLQSEAVTVICPGCGKDSKVVAHNIEGVERTGVQPTAKDLMVCDACLCFITWNDSGEPYIPTHQVLEEKFDQRHIDEIYATRKVMREESDEAEAKKRMLEQAGGLLDALGLKRKEGQGAIQVVDVPLPPGRFHA